CIDIAVWAMSAEAERAPTERLHPSRVWYVVNRRLLVDEGAERALRLSRLLSDPAGEASASYSGENRPHATEVLSIMAERLASRTSVAQQEGPLHVGRLRGGIAIGELPTNPAQPAVLLATVPMFGSRLLFRGYGASRYTRSLDASYAGTDSLVLLDEAHLADQLRTTAGQLVEADPSSQDVLPGKRSEPRLVALTATGNPEAERFELDESDLSSPIVAQRVNARKPVRLLETRKPSRARTLAEAATAELRNREQPAAVVVFANTAALVPDVHKALLKTAKGLVAPDDVVVLTGRFRGDDATRIREQLLNGPASLRSGRTRSALPAHRVVIATQTLEVGADLDFDILISESAGVRAITQRLGRLNRLGEATSETPAVIVHAADQKADPVYGTEPAEVWNRLKALANPDLGPLNTALLGDPMDQGARCPELLPNHLDEWAKTTDPPVGEAPVDLFINGIEEN
ncbi:MAG: type I-U CRISPR-associated helicase/endonuclease Cas3, partial [Microthrixaceae bacterium]|nr:type I-U CRISPR-associated helicase/endonuclease Cas3 [Microthrixaceae bacterium]